MKKIKLIKLIILFILVMCMFGLTEMLFQDYIETFADSYHKAHYILPEKGQQSEMNDDMMNAAEKNDVQFFYVDSYMKTDFYGIVNIYYSDESVKDCIAEKNYIKQGNYSAILESHTVNFYPLSEIKNPTKKAIHIFYIDKDGNLSGDYDSISKEIYEENRETALALLNDYREWTKAAENKDKTFFSEKTKG